jgi:hypothetical protein
VTPAEELCRLIYEALTPPAVDGTLPLAERVKAYDLHDELLASRVSAVIGATTTDIDEGAVKFLRERIDATPVTYPTKEA